MNRNLGYLDRFIRVLIGLALFAYSVRDGSVEFSSIAAGVVGVVLLLTAFFSYCPLYTLLGVSSTHRDSQAS